MKSDLILTILPLILIAFTLCRSLYLSTIFNLPFLLLSISMPFFSFPPFVLLMSCLYLLVPHSCTLGCHPAPWGSPASALMVCMFCPGVLLFPTDASCSETCYSMIWSVLLLACSVAPKCNLVDVFFFLVLHFASSSFSCVWSIHLCVMLFCSFVFRLLNSAPPTFFVIIWDWVYGKHVWNWIQRKWLLENKF